MVDFEPAGFVVETIGDQFTELGISFEARLLDQVARGTTTSWFPPFMISANSGGDHDVEAILTGFGPGSVSI